MMKNLFSRVSFMAIFLSLFLVTPLNAHPTAPEGPFADAQPTLHTELSAANLFYPGQFNFEHSGFITSNRENFTTWSSPTGAADFFINFWPPVVDCYINYERSETGQALGSLSAGLILAVDFPVGAGETLDLEYINFTSLGDASTYTVALHENNPAGGPGTMIGSPFTVTPVYQKNYLSPDAFEVRLDVRNQNISLSGESGGKMYWVSLTSTQGTRYVDTYWVGSESINNGTNFYLSDDYSFWDDVSLYGYQLDGSLSLNCEDTQLRGACDIQFVPSEFDGTVNYTLVGGTSPQRHSFNVPVGNSSFTVNGMSLNLVVDPDSDLDLGFNITLMEDFQGVPGNVLNSTAATVNCGGFLTTLVSDNIYMSYKIEFDEALTLDANSTYWIEVESDAVGWEINSNGNTGKTSAFITSNNPNTWILSDHELVYSLICGEVGSNCFDTLACEDQGVDFSEATGGSLLSETQRRAADIPVGPDGLTMYGVSFAAGIDAGVSPSADFEIILYETTTFGLPAAEIASFTPRVGGTRYLNYTLGDYLVYEYDLYIDSGFFLEGDKVYWLEIQTDEHIGVWMETTNTQVANGIGYLIPENNDWNISQESELIYSLICDPPAADMCEWTVHIWDNLEGDEVNWQLREQDTAKILLQGTGYSGTGYNITESVLATGPVDFFITSDIGGVGNNAPNYEVSNENDTLISGSLDGGTSAYYSDLSCDMPFGPDNDDACEAISIACDETISGNTTGATDSGLPTDCEWSTIESDVWYKFDADGTSDYSISLTGTNSSDMLLSVYSGDCSALTEVDCMDDWFSGTENVSLNAPDAGTYYIRVVAYDADAEFDLTLECIQDTDDDCLNTSAYMTTSAPTTPNPKTISTCTFAGDYNTITDAVAGNEYTFTATGGTGNYLTIREGSYDGPVIGQGVSPVSVTATQNGSLYMHLTVDADCTTDSSCHTTTVACSSCLVEGPENDDACDAVDIACDETISGSTSGASDSGLPTDCEWSTIESDVWYKFDADGTSDYTVSLTDTNTSDMLLSVYSGDCSALTEVDCMDDWFSGTESVTLTAPAAGTYHIRVVTYDADAEFDLLLECESGGSNGETCSDITIGEGGTSTSSYMPIYYLYDYSYSQAIYTADELQATGAGAGNITQIAYLPNASVTTADWRNWSIYMANITQSEFTGTSDWLPVTGSMQEVFSGEIADNTLGGQWLEIVLDSSFAWDGTSNIVVAVVDNTLGWGGYPNWQGYSAGSNRGIYAFRDSTPYDVDNPGTASNTTSTIPQIRFCGDLLPSCTGADAGIIEGPAISCANTPFTLEAVGASSAESGLVTQWQSSSDGTAWTDIVGETETVLYTEITAPTYFRYTVECTLSGDSEESAAHFVDLNEEASECYCVPSGTNSNYYINDFTTTGGNENIINLDTGFSPGGYGDFFNTHTVEQSIGESVDFEAVFGNAGYTFGFRIWVDWNQDGVFDPDTELAYNSTAYEASHSGTITVPSTALEGETRMRIVNHYLNSQGDVDPCQIDFTYGEFEDYKFIVGDGDGGGPENDDACDAIDIACDETISGSTTGATDSGLPSDCEWDDFESDVWYKFEADGSSNYTVSLTDTNTSDMLLSVYSGDCNALTEVDCMDNWYTGTETVSLSVPDAGTYYIRVVTYDADAEFDLELSCMEPIVILPPDYPCYQGDGINPDPVENGYGIDAADIYRVAAPIFVDPDTEFELKEITIDVMAMGDITNATINILEDDGGLPGEVLPGYTYTMAPTDFVIYDEALGFDVYHLVFELPATDPLPEGTYWIEPTMDNASGGPTYWRMFTGGTQGLVATRGTEDWGINSDGYHAVFFAAGECNPTDGEPGEGECSDIIIGEGGTSTSSYIPIYYLYDYSYSQAIYTADELQATGAGAGSITQIAYLPTSSVTTADWRNWTIYMAHTTKDNFSDASDWIPVTGTMQEVFNGDLPDDAVENEWLEINLDSSFAWDGNSNIVIAVVDNTDGWGGSPDWKGYSADSDRGLYLYRDGTPIDVDNPGAGTGNSVTANLPQIKFCGDLLPDCADADAGVIDGPEISCPDTPFTLEAVGASSGESGLIRQWQSSTDGTAWTDIEGESNTVLYTEITAPTYFRYTVECVYSGDSDTSAAHFVDLNTVAEECYCVPEGTNASRYINDFTTTGGVDNISNLDSGFSPGGYGNFYDTHNVTQEQGGTIAFEAVFGASGSTFGFRAWVDWNQDGIFDPVTEVVYSSSSYAASHSGNITVPADANLGETRMRIANHWLSTTGDVDPCATDFVYGEFEDYKFTVLEGDGNGTGDDCEIVCPEDIVVTSPDGEAVAVDYEVTFIGEDCGEEEPVTITQNIEPAPIIDGIDCANETEGTTGGSLWRAYEDLPLNFRLDAVEFGLYDAGYFTNLHAQVFVYSYTGAVGGTSLDLEAMTLIAQSDFETYTDFGMKTADLITPVVIPPDTKIVVEVRRPAGDSPWSSGVSDSGETTHGYISVVDEGECGISPTPVSFPSMGLTQNLIQKLVGETTALEIVQISGLPSGSEFPIGTTTNCFELRDADGNVLDECCFDVTVNTEAEGDPCWQGIPSFSTVEQAYNIEMSTPFRTAEDFTVEEDVLFTLSQLTFDTNQQSVPDNAVINIREDVGGQPGAILHTLTFGEPDEWEIVGEAFGDPLYHMVYNLIAPLEFTEGAYWVDPKMSASTGETIWWAATAQATDGAWPQRSTDDGANWTEEPGMSMVFTVAGHCATLGLGDASSFDFSYYPNPVRDVLYIHSPKNIESVRVFNLVGQEVMNTNEVTDGSLNVGKLTTGAYVFRVILEGGQVETFKIIKR